jgi:hypothetical protein
MIILRCADIPGFFEKVLRAVVEADAKGAKRLAFHQTLIFFDFHRVNITPGAEFGKGGMIDVAGGSNWPFRKGLFDLY